MALSSSQICGHRGAAANFPENTLASFNAAHAMRVGSVETDIQMLADGELILFHDERLGRTVPGDSSITELCWNDVASLDVGSWKGAKFSDQRILRVKDLLDWQQATSDAPSIIWEMKLLQVRVSQGIFYGDSILWVVRQHLLQKVYSLWVSTLEKCFEIFTLTLW